MAEKEPKVFLNRAEEIAYEREQRGRQEGETHGDILPLRRNKQGKLEFAIPQFLLDAYNSLTLPRDVIEGHTPSDEEIAEFAGNVGLAGVGTSAKAAKEAGPNALGMFLGFKSHGADLGKLAKASSLQSKGATREEIWEATGWWKGKDDQWRYEISDEAFDLTPEAKKALKAEEDALVEFDDGPFGVIRVNDNQPSVEGNIEDVFSHPELYRNYENNDLTRPIVPKREKPTDPNSFQQVPFIKEQHDSKAKIGRADPGRAEGMYTPDTDSYYAAGSDDDALLRTAAHELQHGVQRREGFARGSSPDEAASIASKVMQELPPEVFNFMQARDMARANPDNLAFQLRAQKAFRPVEPHWDKVEPILTWLDRDSWENYKAVDGEAEANLTAARLKMTDAERKAAPPWTMYEQMENFSVKEEDIWNPTEMADRFNQLKEAFASYSQPAASVGKYAEGGQVIDPVSGNEVPAGSQPEEVRDDVPIMASEGEYVIPADVVRFLGLDKIESLINKAKEGLKDLEAQGRIGGDKTDEEELPFDPTSLEAIEEDGAGEMQAFAEGGQVEGRSEGMSVRSFKNKDGRVINIPFTNGQPLFSVPAGYSEVNPTEVTEEAPDPNKVVDTGSGDSVQPQPVYVPEKGDNNKDVPASRLAGDPKNWTVEDFINYGKQKGGAGEKAVGAMATFMPLAGIGMKLRERYLDKTTAELFDQMTSTGLDLQGNPIAPEQKTLLSATADSLKKEMADETGLDLSPSKNLGEAFDRFSNFVGGMINRRSPTRNSPRDAMAPSARGTPSSVGDRLPAPTSSPSSSQVPQYTQNNSNDPGEGGYGRGTGDSLSHGGLYKKGGYVTKRKK